MNEQGLLFILGFFILLTLGLARMGVTRPERRTFFYPFAAMAGALTVLMAVVFWIIYRMPH